MGNGDFSVSRKGNGGDGGRIIFHVDMDAFFASVEQRRNPQLRGRPVVVVGRPPRTVVASASYEARAFGVRANMPLFEAQKRCPGIHWVEGNVERYIAVFLRIVGTLRKYSPHIEVASIDEAYLDMTRSRLIFPFPRRLAEAIKRGVFDEVGLTCSVGVGPNKLIAKLASSRGKPDGLIVVSTPEVPHFLDTLPIGHLGGIGSKREAILRSLGIRYCGDLKRIPKNLLRERLGSFGERLYKMGLGIDETPVMPLDQEPDPKSFGHFVTVPQDTKDERIISGFLLRLSEQVGRRLRKNGFSGKRVTLTVRFANFSTLSRQKTSSGPLRSGKEIYRLALRIWDSLRDERPVRLLGITVSSLERASPQLSLFSESNKGKTLEATVDRVNDKYGDFSLTWGSLFLPPR